MHVLLPKDNRRPGVPEDVLGLGAQPAASWRGGVVLGVGGVLASLLVALLVSDGNGLQAALVLLAIPAAILGIRYPMTVFWLWLAVAPFLADTDGGLARRAFWVIHRGLPLLAVLAIVINALLNSNSDHRLRFRGIEWTMVGYAIATYVSILYTSGDPGRSSIVLYDRVVVPMLLFYLVTSSGLSKKHVSRLVPAAVWIVFSQSLIGFISWTSPGILPRPWLGREGERTVGSLQLPGTYSTALLFGALLLMHYVMSESPSRRRAFFSLSLTALGFFMVFMTFSRASWLAGAVAAAGLLWLYPKKMMRVVAVAVPILIFVVGAGLLSTQSDYAQARLGSSQTAAGRLPVMYAAVQMWQAEPLLGFGYGNFELYDRDFQREVNGFIPQQDHASHNVYLTVLAEQGIIGLGLFFAPVLLVFGATLRAWGRMEVDGFGGRRLVGMLWIVLGTHVAVNNFANMKSIFGLGMWWITLALIFVHVSPHQADADSDEDIQTESVR